MRPHHTDSYSNGSSDTTTLYQTSSAVFTSADQGDVITGTYIPSGTQIVSVLSSTAVTLSNATTASGSGLSFSLVRQDYDILGADAYNYGCYDDGTEASPTCPATGDGGWKSFQQTVDDSTASNDRAGTNKLTLLGLTARLGKRVILDEVGSHPGCGGSSDFTHMCNGSSGVTSRSTWMSDAYTYQTADLTFRKYVIGWNYYHTDQRPNGGHDWRFLDDGTTGAAAPDSRGRAAYGSFTGDASYLKTAHSYIINLNP